jgi:hypothetical protein
VIRAIWDEGFKRSYKKRVKKNEELRGPQLRTHKLTGKLEGLWAWLSALTMTIGLSLSLSGKTRSSSSTLEVTMKSISHALALVLSEKDSRYGFLRDLPVDRLPVYEDKR